MVAYTFYETDNRVRRYAETLVKRGDEVDAIVLRRAGQSAFEVIRGVNVYRIQKRIIDEARPIEFLLKLLSFFLRSSWMLMRHNFRRQYDLIHVHSVPDFEVFSTIAPKLLGAKVILDIHDIVPELYASKFKIGDRSLLFKLLVAMERLSVRYSDHVIIANHLWEERLVGRSCPPDLCTTILNYPDPSIFQPRGVRDNVDPKHFVMYYPGSLSHHQGVDLIITAMSVLGERAANFKLVVVGDGPEYSRLRELVVQHGLEDQIRITSGVPLEQVAAGMESASLGVEPKRKRSFGNEALSTKILEFMAMGVPVLASDTVINRRYFSDGLVEFFDSEDVNDLASAIIRLANDPGRRSELIERGRKFVMSNNWNVKAHEYLNLVDDLVTPARAREIKEWSTEKV
jgi:glycosyltransferase involved in cell wall biosynthesis